MSEGTLDIGQNVMMTSGESGDGTNAAANCELCEATRFTHWYAEDDVCWSADCEACLVPMVVWKPHGTDPSQADLVHMRGVLSAAACTRFGDVDFVLDEVMRTIPEHWHAHARDADWFHMRSQRRLSRYTGVGTPREER